MNESTRKKLLEGNYSEDELWTALVDSVSLQSHYAQLLNMYDGGQRLTFEKDLPFKWLERLREIARRTDPRQGGLDI